MNLRDALVQQSPSLALQRAAADRIAALEQELEKHEKFLDDRDLWDYFNQWEIENGRF